MTAAATCKDRLQSYLREHGVCFTLQHHPQAFTAQKIAASEHIPGDELCAGAAHLADTDPIGIAYADFARPVGPTTSTFAHHR